MSRNTPALKKTDGPSSTVCVKVSRPCGSSAAQHCICAAQRSRSGHPLLSDFMRSPCPNPPRPPARPAAISGGVSQPAPGTSPDAYGAQCRSLPKNRHVSWNIHACIGTWGDRSQADTGLVQRLHRRLHSCCRWVAGGGATQAPGLHSFWLTHNQAQG